MRKDEITVIAIKKEKLYILLCYCMFYLLCVYSMRVCMQCNVLVVSYTGALGSLLLSVYVI